MIRNKNATGSEIIEDSGEIWPVITRTITERYPVRALRKTAFFFNLK